MDWRLVFCCGAANLVLTVLHLQFSFSFGSAIRCRRRRSRRGFMITLWLANDRLTAAANRPSQTATQFN